CAKRRLFTLKKMNLYCWNFGELENRIVLPRYRADAALFLQRPARGLDRAALELVRHAVGVDREAYVRGEHQARHAQRFARLHLGEHRAVRAEVLVSRK